MNKRSLILSGLTSSLGVFITKAIGILYVSPFTQIAGQQNTAFYSYGYTFYDFMLQLAIAGIPVASATLISRYVARNDIAMMLMVNRFIKRLLFLIGVVIFIILFVAAPWIVPFIIGFNASSTTFNIMVRVIRLVALAMFVTPILSSYRSFMQGLKEMRYFAASQVLEQIIRVSFLIGMSVLVVNVLQFDPIYSIYVAMLAASIAGIVAIIDLFIKERRIIRSFNIDKNALPKLPLRAFLSEVFNISIPFLIVSVLSNLEHMITLFGFNATLLSFQVAETEVTLLFTIIMFTTRKLISIPHVLALGFSIAIIPYISEAFILNNRKKMQTNINDAIETVFLIALPIIAGLFVFAREIYYVFYDNYAVIGGFVLQVSSIQALLTVISPVIVNILIVLQLRRRVVLSLTLAFLVKLIVFVPLMYWLGYIGAVVASIVSHIVLVGSNIAALQSTYRFSFARVRARLLLMFIAALIAAVIGHMFILLGWHNIVLHSRIETLLRLILSGGTLLGVYVATVWMFGLPQIYISQRRQKHAKSG